MLNSAGWEVVNEGLKVSWNPDDEAIWKCIDFGKEIYGKIA
jgi:hypothetical protein